MEIQVQPHENRKILVVEDDSSIQLTLLEFLRHEGYEPVLASDGQEALDLLQQGLRPCLILLDLTMPGMNGWEFLKARAQDPILSSMPVIVLSAVADAGNTAGATAFLTKPYNVDDLLRLVRQHCKSSFGNDRS